MATITIPKKMADKDDLIVIPKKELDPLIERAGEAVSEKDVLSWSRDDHAPIPGRGVPTMKRGRIERAERFYEAPPERPKPNMPVVRWMDRPIVGE